MKSLTPQLLNGQQLHDQLQQVTQGIDKRLIGLRVPANMLFVWIEKPNT